ncbi:MAG: hypothetical protein LBU87_05400 [Lactobacillales bacterium]|jgi:indolepyruvate ferredoxin oxidoreductase alpha subunit|nr:hypothetical protein [Lactobacillales bacterium]
MNDPTPKNEIKSGNIAAALAVMHSGVTSAYAYPGTPSTEIMEYLSRNMPAAFWSTNEKTALESALGVSYAGGRSFVSMKHVGLNVAADPFMSGANMKINGGIVIVVADDPGMHSSQNEQDTRYFADFARTPCFEPTTVQETYDMIREGFDISEKYNKLVVVRMTTRLSHSKGSLALRPPLQKMQKEVAKSQDWNVVPAFSKRNWQRVLDQYHMLESLSETIACNSVNTTKGEVGVITSGLGKQYFLEQKLNLPHLHVGFYPFPAAKIADFAKGLTKIYVIEEGYPYLERYLRGIIPPHQEILGKLNGTFPLAGELSPDTVAKGFGIQNDKETLEIARLENMPPRPPQLCKGCPHADSFTFIAEGIKGMDNVIVNADIGCYSLGSLPPFALPITLVDMGASIPMAKGAADSGKTAIGIIGDSTFMHSGMTGLVDCIANNSPVVIVILDNITTAMTGGQPQVIPGERIAEIVQAIGVDKDHIRILNPLPPHLEKNSAILREELDYPGVSVIISKRECIETLRKSVKMKKEAKNAV